MVVQIKRWLPLSESRGIDRHFPESFSTTTKAINNKRKNPVARDKII